MDDRPSTRPMTNVIEYLSTLVIDLNAKPRTRLRSLTITKVEEARLWAQESLRVEGE